MWCVYLCLEPNISDSTTRLKRLFLHFFLPQLQINALGTYLQRLYAKILICTLYTYTGD